MPKWFSLIGLLVLVLLLVTAALPG